MKALQKFYKKVTCLHAFKKHVNFLTKLWKRFAVSGKNPPRKNPPEEVRGRVSVTLGIRLGLSSGGVSGGIFSQNPLSILLKYDLMNIF